MELQKSGETTKMLKAEASTMLIENKGDIMPLVLPKEFYSFLENRIKIGLVEATLDTEQPHKNKIVAKEIVKNHELSKIVMSS